MPKIWTKQGSLIVPTESVIFDGNGDPYVAPVAPEAVEEDMARFQQWLAQQIPWEARAALGLEALRKAQERQAKLIDAFVTNVPEGQA